MLSGWIQMFSSWFVFLQVNVLALSICTREAYQSMKERNIDDGHIINLNRLVRWCTNDILPSWDHDHNAYLNWLSEQTVWVCTAYPNQFVPLPSKNQSQNLNKIFFTCLSEHFLLKWKRIKPWKGWKHNFYTKYDHKNTLSILDFLIIR